MFVYRNDCESIPKLLNNLYKIDIVIDSISHFISILFADSNAKDIKWNESFNRFLKEGVVNNTFVSISGKFK